MRGVRRRDERESEFSEFRLKRKTGEVGRTEEDGAYFDIKNRARVSYACK